MNLVPECPKLMFRIAAGPIIRDIFPNYKPCPEMKKFPKLTSSIKLSPYFINRIFSYVVKRLKKSHQLLITYIDL